MNITLVLLRFDPMGTSDVEVAVIMGELPRVQVKTHDEPFMVLKSFLQRCVNAPKQLSQVRLVTFTRGSEGLTCVYKLSLPRNIHASNSFTWVKYDKLGEATPAINERDQEIIRQCYHS